MNKNNWLTVLVNKTQEFKLFFFFNGFNNPEQRNVRIGKKNFYSNVFLVNSLSLILLGLQEIMIKKKKFFFK